MRVLLIVLVALFFVNVLGVDETATCGGSGCLKRRLEGTNAGGGNGEVPVLTGTGTRRLRRHLDGEAGACDPTTDPGCLKRRALQGGYGGDSGDRPRRALNGASINMENANEDNQDQNEGGSSRRRLQDGAWVDGQWVPGAIYVGDAHRRRV